MNIVRRPLDRAYSVQELTGFPVATNPSGSWVRGQVVRGASPVMALPGYHYMFDGSDPLSIEARLDYEKRQTPRTIRSG